MPSTTILISLGIIIIGFVIGIVFYYVIATESATKRKANIESVVSLLINFVIYIWLGKIIVNFPKFIKDPLAILAYPSNSYAFYVATIFILINLIYRKYRHQERLEPIIIAFIPIILGASFMYEFLQVVVQQYTSNKYYLIFITFLIISYLIMQGKINIRNQSYLFGFLLLFGQFILSLMNKLIIFHYRLTPLYFIVLIIMVLSTIVFKHKRKV